MIRALGILCAATTACGGGPVPGADAGDGAGDAVAPDAAPSACAARQGGALITFDIVGEAISLWSTNDAFIAESLERLADGESPRVAAFQEVRAGSDCDTRWNFHVAPAEMEWADLTVEVCDARPSYIEANLEAWIRDVGNWCPWGVDGIVAVDDRR